MTEFVGFSSYLSMDQRPEFFTGDTIISFLFHTKYKRNIKTDKCYIKQKGTETISMKQFYYNQLGSIYTITHNILAIHTIKERSSVPSVCGYVKLQFTRLYLRGCSCAVGDFCIVIFIMKIISSYCWNYITEAIKFT